MNNKLLWTKHKPWRSNLLKKLIKYFSNECLNSSDYFLISKRKIMLTLENLIRNTYTYAVRNRRSLKGLSKWLYVEACVRYFRRKLAFSTSNFSSLWEASIKCTYCGQYIWRKKKKKSTIIFCCSISNYLTT